MTARGVPESDFAVVRDIEREMIVDSGTYSEMVGRAEEYNRIYQSVAYKAELWIHNRIY